jgi:hypothetical protein
MKGNWIFVLYSFCVDSSSDAADVDADDAVDDAVAL